MAKNGKGGKTSSSNVKIGTRSAKMRKETLNLQASKDKVDKVTKEIKEAKSITIKMNNDKLNITSKNGVISLKDLTPKQARRAIGRLTKENKGTPLAKELHKVAGQLSDRGLFKLKFGKDIEKWTQGNNKLAKKLKDELFRNFKQSTTEQDLQDKLSSAGARILMSDRLVKATVGGGRHLIGKKAENGFDIARLGASLANDTEAFRVIYIKDGIVKAVDTTTDKSSDSATINLTGKVNKMAQEVNKQFKKLIDDKNKAGFKFNEDDIAKFQATDAKQRKFVNKVFKETINIINKKAKRLGNADVYLMHNHPSGNAEPSGADKNVTRFLSQNIPNLKAHVVVGNKEFSELRPARDRLSEVQEVVLRQTTGTGTMSNEKQVAKEFNKLGKEIAKITKNKILFNDMNILEKMTVSLVSKLPEDSGAISLVTNNKGKVIASYELSKDLFEPKNEAKLYNVFDTIKKQHSNYTNILLKKGTNTSQEKKQISKLMQSGKAIDVITYMPKENVAKSHFNQFDYQNFQNSLGRQSDANRTRRID